MVSSGMGSVSLADDDISVRSPSAADIPQKSSKPLQFYNRKHKVKRASKMDMGQFAVKNRTSSTPNIEYENNTQLQTEEQTTEQILQHEKSAAAILCQLKTPHGTQASHLPLTKDVLGIVATLGKVEDDNLSRLFAEYLGVQTMLAIVCKTYEGVKALETYDNEGCINKCSGLHGLGASNGRALDGRFLVICLENLIPYVGGFVADDPQRRLDLIKPRLPNGECPLGFLGFAVNMINVDNTNLFCLTASGYGLREMLFYNLFSHLQVYRTRAEMLLALPCISDGALSLDGGMIRSTGVFSMGNREDVDVKFPKPLVTSTLRENNIEAESQVKEMKWKKEKMLEDMKREEALLHAAKFDFDKKKQEFLKFLAGSSSYATQKCSAPKPPLCSSFSLTKELSISKTSTQSSRLLKDSQMEGDAYLTNLLHEGSHLDNELMGSSNLMDQMSPSQVEIKSSAKKQRGSNFTLGRSTFLNEVWRHRALTPETRFDNVGKFQERENVKWAVREFRRRQLKPLLKPVHNVIRQRFVRLFYQNMSFESDRPRILSSVIDGVKFEVSIADIANALGCPHECPPDIIDSQGAPRYTDFPSGLDVRQIVHDMCEGRFTNGRDNCTSKSLLPPRLWLVDTVLQKNVCPLGHKTQRRGEFLDALYAFHGGYWFSAPRLIWLQMHKCWEGLVNKKLQVAQSWALPFPFLVTKLIMEKGVAITDDDFAMRDIPVFGLQQWNQSVSHMRQRDPALELARDEELAPNNDMPDADMAEGETSFRAEERVSLSHTKYKLIQAELKKIHEEQEKSRKMLQEILCRLPPAPPAP